MKKKKNKVKIVIKINKNSTKVTAKNASLDDIDEAIFALNKARRRKNNEQNHDNTY